MGYAGGVWPLRDVCAILVIGEVGEHAVATEGHWNEGPDWGPDIIISRINVSIGVLPTNLTKNNCSITAEDTVRKLGNRSRSFPNLMGWFGYWVLQYSSKAHCDFSCNCSIVCTSVKLGASETQKNRIVRISYLHYEILQLLH